MFEVVQQTTLTYTIILIWIIIIININILTRTGLTNLHKELYNTKKYKCQTSHLKIMSSKLLMKPVTMAIFVKTSELYYIGWDT